MKRNKCCQFGPRSDCKQGLPNSCQIQKEWQGKVSKRKGTKDIFIEVFGSISKVGYCSVPKM